MKQHIELELSPHECYLLLDLINDRLHFWEEKESLVACRGKLVPSSVEYDPFFIESRIRELKSLKVIYLASVRQSRIQT